jgi:hypothetical protein
VALQTTKDERPAFPGTYYITKNPNPKPGTEDWFGLLRQDGEIDDRTTENGKEQSGVRLHYGSLSHGCVTVNKYAPDNSPDNRSTRNNYSNPNDKKWEELKNMIQNTSTGLIDFQLKPGFSDSKVKIKNYGTLEIIN